MTKLQRGLKPKDRKLATQSKGKLTANQWQNTPQQNLFMELWLSPALNSQPNPYFSNAYQSALQTKNQLVSNAQAVLDQANSSLNALVSAARPEDVAVAQAQVNNADGAVQIAEAAYENTIIVAPTDGTIMSVSITPGQIAVVNAPAIEFTSISK